MLPILIRCYYFQDDIMTFEGEQQAELLQLFQPVYLKLVDTFIQKSLLPPDNALSAEEKEMFRCYRQDICDTYVSVGREDKCTFTILNANI